MRGAIILHNTEVSKIISEGGIKALFDLVKECNSKILEMLGTRVVTDASIMYENKMGSLYVMSVGRDLLIHLWDVSGLISIGQYDIDNWYTMEEDIRLFEKGIVHCAKCRERIDLKTAAVMFAGRYCTECSKSIPDGWWN